MQYMLIGDNEIDYKRNWYGVGEKYGPQFRVKLLKPEDYWERQL